MDSLINQFRHLFCNLTQVELNQKLFEAAKTGNLDNLKFFIQSGAEINAKDMSGFNSLMIACQNGHANVAAFLINNGADIFATTPDENQTILMLASLNGLTSIVALLLKMGADIHSTCNHGGNALIAACRENHTETAALLISKGANIYAENKYGINALAKAKDWSHTQTVYLLLSLITQAERDAFANKLNAHDLVNEFNHQLEINNTTTFHQMNKIWKECEPDSSIFRVLPTELILYIRELETLLTLQEKFKGNWYYFCLETQMKSLAQSCHHFPLNKPVYPVLFLSKINGLEKEQKIAHDITQISGEKSMNTEATTQKICLIQ